MRRTVLLPAAALVLAACSGGEPSNRATPEPTVSVVLPSGKPTPSIPPTKPTKLQQTDLVVGTGETAIPGKTLTVRYVGVHYDGKEFDSNFEPGESTISFVLGNERVIPGWDQGLIGMREGGRRQLVIPPELGYGAAGSGPIGPNETLVFVVDLISVDAGI
ncbi:MAG TPA: FKBP-type peptidyl-prolyl cis-trans isomerase [Frankiaceae bacterium]|nr:FKBP-type peptidyl-prolyl cis-trans isomerase [Frankiaceae bacterium]